MNYYFNDRLDVLDENAVNDCNEVFYAVVNDVEKFKAFCDGLDMIDYGVTSTGMYYFDGDYGDWVEYDLRAYNTLIKYMK